MSGDASVGPAARAGLAYYGAISAALSHEMRNVVAAMNENAGLLGDFAAAAGKGRPIDPARPDVVHGRVARFVARSDRLLSCFSRLAHAVDDEWRAVDLAEAAEDVVILAGRIIAARGREVTVVAPAATTVTTSPLFVRALLWRCIEVALNDPGRDAGVTVVVAARAGGGEIRIGAGDGEVWRGRDMPDELDLDLCALAACSMRVDGRTGGLVLAWEDSPE